MNRILNTFLAAAAIAVAVPSVAGAARWQSINERQASLQHRIDQGVRDGSLNRQEASRVRTQFANLQRLELQYRRHGLSYRERVDLDRRFNKLGQHIYAQRHDRQTRRGRTQPRHQR